MEYLEKICVKNGLKRIVLDVGRRNVPARNLYRRCGFLSVGFRKDYYTVIGDDAIVMEKWLRSPESNNQVAHGTEVP
jgi:ribosomal protein S18 acetylase RimI-like enzyme